MLLRPIRLQLRPCTDAFDHITHSFSRHSVTSSPLRDDEVNLPAAVRDHQELHAHHAIIRQLGHVSRTLRHDRDTQESKFENSISPAETYRWREVASASNMTQALRRFSDNDSREKPAAERSIANRIPALVPPTWLLMYLLSTKVRTTHESLVALFYTLDHLTLVDPQDQPSLLILVVRVLARYQVVAHLQPPIDAFLELNMPQPSVHFNLLLRAMSKFRQCVDVAKMITKILQAMEARQLRLRGDTYTSLLQNRAVTLQLTKTLQQRMSSEGFIPRANHLEAFLRVFGKSGAVHGAARYLSAIRKLRHAQDDIVPHSVDLDEQTEPVHSESRQRVHASTRHNTIFLRSLFRHRPAAFQYLRDLVEADKVQDPTLFDQWLRRRRSRIGNQSHGVRWQRPKVGIYDWTTALYIAGRDRTISTDALLLLFRQSQKSFDPPTQATYTAVMRALVARYDFAAAYSLWKEMVRKKFIDRQALTVGVKALVGAGREVQAFNMLEQYLLKPGWRPPIGKTNRTSRQFTADILIINSFMSGLVFSGRPDVVFKLWDHMGMLYGVKPDETSLAILMVAARIAMKYDASLRGILMHVNQYNPFRHTESNDEHHVRENKVAAIRRLLYVEKDSKPKITGFWGDEPAAHKAMQLFRLVLFLNKPFLRTVGSPATPYRSDAAQQPVGTFVRKMLHSGDNVATSATTDVSTTLAQSRRDIRALTPFSHISPNDRTFRAYIRLLSSLDRASEVPLVLAWMKELRIKPSKETMSLAIILWAEVGLQGPLQETFLKGNSQYNKLILWLKDWLGPDALPSDMKLARSLRPLAKERDPQNRRLTY